MMTMSDYMNYMTPTCGAPQRQRAPTRTRKTRAAHGRHSEFRLVFGGNFAYDSAAEPAGVSQLQTCWAKEGRKEGTAPSDSRPPAEDTSKPHDDCMEIGSGS